MSFQQKLRENPKLGLFVYTIVPLLIFAIIDEQYWEILNRDFGLQNSWYLIAIDLHGRSGPITYPNSPFIIFLAALIGLNIVLYQRSTRNQKIAVSPPSSGKVAPLKAITEDRNNQ